jgi:DNA-binding transcriptional regulator YdaS (Cro superfamily)
MLDTRNPNAMTPAVFEQAMLDLDVTDMGMALFLGVDRTSVVRWRTGARAIPTAVAIVVQLLIEKKVSRRRVRQLAREFSGN